MLCYQQAAKSIYVVDDYMNTKTLQLLSQKQSGVEVILFTENGHGKKGFLTNAVVNDFINQYPTLRIKPNPDCHDRWIILDYELPTEAVYHCGASSKHAIFLSLTYCLSIGTESSRFSNFKQAFIYHGSK